MERRVETRRKAAMAIRRSYGTDGNEVNLAFAVLCPGSLLLHKDKIERYRFEGPVSHVY